MLLYLMYFIVNTSPALVLASPANNGYGFFVKYTFPEIVIWWGKHDTIGFNTIYDDECSRDSTCSTTYPFCFDKI